MTDELKLNILDFWYYMKFIESDILDDAEVINLDLAESFDALENSLEGVGYELPYFNPNSDRKLGNVL